MVLVGCGLVYDEKKMCRWYLFILFRFDPSPFFKFAFLLLHVGTFKRGSQFPIFTWHLRAPDPDTTGVMDRKILCASNHRLPLQIAVSLQSLGGSPAKFSEKKTNVKKRFVHVSIL